MADIDLKTATPDTSLPTTGFLFGADSQASASPSVYSTQTVATTLLGSTSLTGATITTSQPVLDLAQTWNASGVTFTGLKFNATDTASAAASLLMDLQVGGSSRFRVTKDGGLQIFTTNNGGTQLTTRFGFSYFGGGSVGDTTSSAFTIDATNNRFKGRSTAEIGWGNSGTDGNATLDTILTRRAVANLRLGAADVGATTSTVTITIAAPGVVTWSSHGFSTGTPVVFTTTGALPTGITAGTTYYAVVVDANTFQIASSVANAIATPATVITTSGTQSGTHTGTRYNITQRLGMQSNTGVTDRLGADLIIQGSQGTGTGAGGSIIFQAAPAGTTGTAQNSLVEFLRIDSGIRGIVFPVNPSLFGTGGSFSTADGSRGIVWRSTTTGNAFQLSNCGLEMADTNYAKIYFGNISAVGTPVLTYDASGTLALRSGTNPQTFNIYNTFTSSTNFERFRIVAQSAAAVLIGTEKGSSGGTARALELQTDATTRLTIGSGGGFTIADAQDIAVGSTTGTKIGTATTQKIGFYNKAPVVQPTAVADATDNATAITQLNALLSRMRDLGLIAT